MLIQWKGPILDPVGYATVAREFLLALDKIGAELYLPGGVIGWTKLSKLDGEFFDLFNKIKKKPSKINKTIKVNFMLPTQTNNKTKEKNIVMTLFETTRIPREWTNICNNKFQETWIPNDFNYNIFKNSGVKNLYKVPYGVNLERYSPKVTEIELTDGFKFLSVFDFSYRKNPHGLINAYYRAFDYRDDVVLYIKTWNIPPYQFKSYLSKFNKKNRPKIVLIKNIITDTRMAKLLKSVDVLVMPSYGEGWSMPCLQAMACGTPSIATSWGGQMEFLNSKNSFLISIKGLVPVVENEKIWYRKGMMWADPNVTHLSFLMRFCYENQKEVKKKSKKCIIDSKKWSFINAAKKMLNRCEEIGGN